jgi:putative membrane protein
MKVLCFIAICVLAITLHAQTSGPAAPEKADVALATADQKFVKEAAEGGMAEVELGRLAVEKAASPDVKAFGKRMVDDHSRVNDQLKQLASLKGVDVPQAINPKQRATKERLEKLSGQQFDQAYMAEMLLDHEKDVAEFTQTSQSAKDSDLKQFAFQALPTLQDHLKQAQTITSGNRR